MKHAIFDDNGIPLAFYSAEINGDAIPANAVDISDEQWQEFIDNNGFRRWLNGAVVAYWPPAPPPVIPDQISDRQFFQQLAILGLITQTEALQAVKVGTVPEAMQAVINALPADAQFNANMLLSGATTFERSNLLVNAFGAAQGMNAAQIDALWVAAAAL